MPATALTVSGVEAETTGMERRGERREGRYEQRDTRRGNGKETGTTGAGISGTK